MLPAELLPHLDGFALEDVTVEDRGVVLVVAPRQPTAACPQCARPSRRVHSRYQRTLHDLPIGERGVALRVRARRFRCVSRGCSRRVFAERLPELTAAHARRTHGQRAALAEIGLALGGAAGARLAEKVRLGASRASILRIVHRMPDATGPTPRVLGVDDWAKKRGRAYGTILVDLERRRPVAVLPERSAEAFAQWLKGHPGVEIIARDRGGLYADGARQGAPHAVQVADRFHLLANAGDALERVLAREHRALRAAAAAIDQQKATTAATVAIGDPSPVASPAVALTKAEQRRLDRRARRQARYDEVVRLFAQGIGLRAIGRHVGISRKTVARYVSAGGFPERAPRAPRPSSLAPHREYLRERWAAGCHNARALWSEIRARGFTGAASLVRADVAAWRTTPARRGRHARQLDAPGSEPAPTPTPARSPRRARGLLLRPLEDLCAEERAYRTALIDAAPIIETARELIDQFGRLVRERDRVGLEPWLQQMATSGVAEMREFANGIRRDQAAVQAALCHEWSNGQTEGQINRLKLLKRQMYGRASVDLLRRRLLQPA